MASVSTGQVIFCTLHDAWSFTTAYCCTVMSVIFMHDVHGPQVSSLVITSLALNFVHISMILPKHTAVWLLQGAHMTCVQSACRYSKCAMQHS